MNFYQKVHIEYSLDNIHHSRYLAYTAWGNPNKPAILCVHALTRNARDFDLLAQALSNKYYVICLDIAGRGQSDPMPDPLCYNYSCYLHDIILLLKKLNITKFSWIGTSMGGIIGMVFASLYPGILDKLIINDVGAFIPKEALQRIAKYVGRTFTFDNLHELEQQLRKNFAPFGITDDLHWKHMAKHSFWITANNEFTFAYDPQITLGTFRSDPAQIEDADLWDIWQKISCPTLVIRGTKSDILQHETYLKMLEKPQVNGIEYKNIGHAPSLMEQSQIKDIHNWLN
ncbi:alpha/beta fold hydrolase [Rickettsiales endosymbiont of Stachyamoeba lipophora]|uniref:alpha/beta fold hydrolase n=1 Tax=Rickettsiales endosymbiont of Stachyamoeba lipophora TaxID=2486578 RepID=UPI000F6514A1|nr:alpha/beta hydrolase [Rickettsiales endosymbiont of Stachyamoeba lipophora]AZL15314.1 alpha/beta hydrolase [Rickettsiales endosymbiont of Stachyamoeba lipophora]